MVTLGSVQLTSDDAKDKPRVLSAGMHHGEEMLLYDDTHMYTLKATKGDAVVYVLTKRTFHLVFKWAQKREFGANQKLILTMPIFHHLTPKERMRLAGALQVERFMDGQVILKAGDKIGHLYIMRTGEASLRKGSAEVAHKYPGDYFGEESLFGATASEHDVLAKGENVEIAYITRQDFIMTVGEPKEVLQRDTSALNKLAIGAIPLLAVLDASTREKLANNLGEVRCRSPLAASGVPLTSHTVVGHGASPPAPCAAACRSPSAKDQSSSVWATRATSSTLSRKARWT